MFKFLSVDIPVSFVALLRTSLMPWEAANWDWKFFKETFSLLSVRKTISSSLSTTDNQSFFDLGPAVFAHVLGKSMQRPILHSWRNSEPTLNFRSCRISIMALLKRSEVSCCYHSCWSPLLLRNWVMGKQELFADLTISSASRPFPGEMMFSHFTYALAWTKTRRTFHWTLKRAPISAVQLPTLAKIIVCRFDDHKERDALMWLIRSWSTAKEGEESECLHGKVESPLIRSGINFSDRNSQIFISKCWTRVFQTFVHKL